MATVFETMMKVGFDNSIFGHLGKLSAELRAIHLLVGHIGTGIGGWKTALGVVAGAVALGGTVAAMESLAKHGAEVNHQLNLMATKGFTADQVNLAKSLAFKTSTTVAGSVPSQNLEHMNELMYVFGGYEHMAPVFEKIEKMNQSLNNMANGKGGKDAVFALAKTLEERHLTGKPDEFMEYAEAMFKAVTATGGRVTPQDFQMAFKYGKTSALNWDTDFIQDYLPRLIQMMKANGGSGAGGGPGAALMSMSQAVVNGRIGKTLKPNWEEMGLIGEDGKVRGSEIFQSNPGKWVQTELMPALAAMGKTTDKEITEAISKLFGNRNADFIAAVMAMQGGPGKEFDKDSKLNRQAMSVDEQMKLMGDKDYATIVRNFHAAWKSLLETLGGPMMASDGIIMRSLKGLTGMMQSINQFAIENPKAAESIGTALIGIAGGLALFGTAAVVAGVVALAPGGAAVAAMYAMAGVLTAIAITDPGKILTMLPVFGTIIQLIKDAGNIVGVENLMKIVDGFRSWVSLINSLATSGVMLALDNLIKTFEKIKQLYDMIPGHAERNNAYKKMNFEGEGPSGSLLQNADFNPGGGKQILQPVQIKLDLDGRTLAQAVAEIIEELNLFPTNGGSGNGVHTWDSAGQRLGA
jgi:hypothetical protein